MAKLSFSFAALFLLSLLVSCASKAPMPSPVSDSDSVATIVAGTLSAMQPATPAPAPTQTPVPVTATPPASNLSLDDFPNKELLGEDDHYSIYLVNPTSEEPKTGEIIVYDKHSNLAAKMNGTFKIFGTAIVSDDGRGSYILLSTGTYTLRNAIVLSLAEQKQAVDNFCISTETLFWNDFMIISNCDTLQNRPWGAGEAPSVSAINLKTGKETVVAKSDLTHQYSVKQIEGNTLHYIETYVENEADWNSQDKQKTDDKTYDLTELGNQ